MVTSTKDKMMKSPVSIFTGVAGAVASTPVGLVLQDNGLDVEYDPQTTELHVQGHDFPLEFTRRARRMAISGAMAQVEAANIATVVDQNLVGQIIEFGNPTDSVFLSQISVAAVGQLADGTAWRIDMPFAVPADTNTITVGQADMSTLPFRFEAVSDPNSSSFPTITVGAGNLTVTIATGDADRGSSAFLFLLGEGGVSDVLDDITGTPALEDGEIVTIQMGNAAQIITVTDLVGTLNLAGVGNMVMAAGDQLALEYDLGGTEWNEKSRFIVTPG